MIEIIGFLALWVLGSVWFAIKESKIEEEDNDSEL